MIVDRQYHGNKRLTVLL